MLNKPEHTFGFAAWRDIERYKERVSWPPYRRNQAGRAAPVPIAPVANREYIRPFQSTICCPPPP